MENGSKEVTPKTQSRKTAADFSQGEIAQMSFDMMINHRIMESRLEKLENRVNLLTSLMSQKGIHVPS
jgi:hypothetical protein